MTALIPRRHVLLAGLARDSVPRALEQAERGSGDYTQAVVWLVGLASTLLALAVANPERVMAIAGHSYRLLCVLLLATIVTGVACRIVSLWSTAFARRLSISLNAYLAGYVVGFETPSPEDFSEDWTAAQVVEKIQHQFGRDYSFLLEYSLTSEHLRGEYRIRLRPMAHAGTGRPNASQRGAGRSLGIQ